MKSSTKWILLVIVRPLILSWIIISGLPQCIRAVFTGIERIVRLFK